jgi:hypothetical protein
MTTTLIAVFLLVALLAANLPWLNSRFLIFILPAGGQKRFWMEFVEWLILYLLVGLMALGLEKKQMGGLHSQDWEFYATTLCLFVVFAIPGFVYRHTLKHYLKH